MQKVHAHSSQGREDRGTGAILEAMGVLTYVDVMAANAGYWNEANAEFCVKQGIDPFMDAGHLPHAWPAIAAKTRAKAQGGRYKSNYNPQAQKQERLNNLCPAQGHLRADERSYKRSQKLAALSAAEAEKGRR